MATTEPSSCTLELQTANLSLDPPCKDVVWSAWYNEADDTFKDFNSFAPAANAAASGGLGPSGGSLRTLSARQISGQFDEEVAKSWEEDWEDEDVEDTFDHVMGQIARHQTMSMATTK